MILFARYASLCKNNWKVYCKIWYMVLLASKDFSLKESDAEI